MGGFFYVDLMLEDFRAFHFPRVFEWLCQINAGKAREAFRIFKSIDWLFRHLVRGIKKQIFSLRKTKVPIIGCRVVLSVVEIIDLTSIWH